MLYEAVAELGGDEHTHKVPTRKGLGFFSLLMVRGHASLFVVRHPHSQNPSRAVSKRRHRSTHGHRTTICRLATPRPDVCSIQFSKPSCDCLHFPISLDFHKCLFSFSLLDSVPQGNGLYYLLFPRV